MARRNPISSSVALAVSGLVLLTLVACGPGLGTRDDERAGERTHRSLEVELPGDASWISVATLGDTIYVLGQPATDSAVSAPDRYLMAIDPKSGAELWRSQFTLPNSGPQIYSSDLVAGDDVLLFRSEYILVALSPEDGSMLWHIEDPSTELRYVGASDGAIYVARYPNQVTAYSTRDGVEKRAWELQGYLFTGYSNTGDLWLTTGGDKLVAVVDASGGSQTEIAAVTLDVTRASASATELFRSKTSYDGNEVVRGPSTVNYAGLPVRERSDHVVREVTAYDKLTLEGWSATTGEQTWSKEITLGVDETGYSGYRGSRFLMTRQHGLVQEPDAEGVLLRSVLRLRLHTLDDFERQWTNVIPTLHYVDAVLDLPRDRTLVHTRSDEGAYGERWYAFDTATGALLWVSKDGEEFVGTTRDIAVYEHTLVRLMTANWVDGRIYLDEF